MLLPNSSIKMLELLGYETVYLGVYEELLEFGYSNFGRGSNILRKSFKVIYPVLYLSIR